MAHITEWRIGESFTTTGTGDITLGGALADHRAFTAACAVGDTFYYDIYAPDSEGNIESGLGTYASGNKVVRTTVDRSSNSDAAVNLPAGTKYIRIVVDRRQVLTGANLATTLHAATAKTSLVDADEVNGTDSANSFSLIRTTWTNVKVFLKTYFDTLYAALATVNTFTKAQRGAFVTLTDAATVALDLSLANQFRLVLGGSRTLGVPTNIVEGQQGVISIRQDATGSRTLSYAWPYQWAGGTAGVLSTAGCTRDLLAYSVDHYNSAVVTITIASPGVVTFTAHGFNSGQAVQITTTGALPTGLTASTTYFVSRVDADSFKLCTTLANAASGTFINTSGSQSGVHTLTGCSISLSLAKAFA